MARARLRPSRQALAFTRSTDPQRQPIDTTAALGRSPGPLAFSGTGETYRDRAWWASCCHRRRRFWDLAAVGHGWFLSARIKSWSCCPFAFDAKAGDDV